MNTIDTAETMTQTPAIRPVPTGQEVRDFHALLVTTLPRLRVQALALTRNRADADDLVQAAVTSALAAQTSFTVGTNFGAWMFRILRNRFISDVRRKRETTEIDDVPSSAFARPGAQEDSLIMQELRGHLAKLPVEQRTALIMVTVQGLSYEEVAAAMECAVGTAKCRVFRARQTLQRMLTGEERGVAAPKVQKSTGRNAPSSPRAARRHTATRDDETGARATLA